MDVARGWPRCNGFPETRIPALTTSTKIADYASGRCLNAPELLSLQGFDPAVLNFAEMSYTHLARLAGRGDRASPLQKIGSEVA